MKDIFELAGVEKPNIGLLSDEFLEDVRKMPLKNLAVELLERLMRDEIRSSTPRRTRAGEEIQRPAAGGAARSITTGRSRPAHVIEELIAMAKDFKAALKRTKRSGLIRR